MQIWNGDSSHRGAMCNNSNNMFLIILRSKVLQNLSKWNTKVLTEGMRCLRVHMYVQRL